MKKLIILSLVVAGFAMTSCKKDYLCSCDVSGMKTEVEYNGLTKSEADDAKAACETTSYCTWSQQ